MIIRLIIDISQVKSGVFSRVRFDWVLIDGLPIDGSHRSRTFSASPIYTALLNLLVQFLSWQTEREKNSEVNRNRRVGFTVMGISRVC
jgi:hypothetical protein